MWPACCPAHGKETLEALTFLISPPARPSRSSPNSSVSQLSLALSEMKMLPWQHPQTVRRLVSAHPAPSRFVLPTPPLAHFHPGSCQGNRSDEMQAASHPGAAPSAWSSEGFRIQRASWALLSPTLSEEIFSSDPDKAPLRS